MRDVMAYQEGGMVGGQPDTLPPELNVNPEEASVFGRLLEEISPQEIAQLKELQDELVESTPEELSTLLEVIDFILTRSKAYPQAVNSLIQRGIVEPGDLPVRYVPTFFAILRAMVTDAIQKAQSRPAGMEEEMPAFAKGGIVSLKKKAEQVRRAGRDGDTMLAHITPREAQALKAMGGAGTINPATGLPEFKSFFSKVGSFLKKAAPVILPVALNFLLPGLGTIASGAIGAGVGSLIAGASPKQALVNGLIGGAVGGIYSGFSGSTGSFLGNVAAGGLPMGLGGAQTSFISPSIAGLFGGGGTGGTVVPGTTSGPGSPQQPLAPSTGSPAGDTGGTMGGGAMKAPTGGVAPVTPVPSPSAGSTGSSFFSSLMPKSPMSALALGGIGGLALGAMAGGGDQAQPKTAFQTMAEMDTGQDLLEKYPNIYGYNYERDFRPIQRQRTYQDIVPPYGGPVYAKAGGHISGPGTGTSDSIPALLSDGEFVMTAKAVRGAGEGSRKDGARKMYELMRKFERRA